MDYPRVLVISGEDSLDAFFPFHNGGERKKGACAGILR